MAHNAADLLVHACNAALVGALAARLTRQQASGWIAAALFAALPAATATAAWMSDRFDTIALLFSLLALFALEKAIARRGTPWLPALLLFIALLSKEIAYAVAAIMLVWLVVLRPWRDKNRLVLLGGVFGCTVLTVILRFTTVAPLDTSLRTSDTAHAFLTGAGGWWRHSLAALNGFQSSSIVFGITVALLAFFATIVIARGIWHKPIDELGVDELALPIIALGLIVLPAFIQWPVTQYALVRDENLAYLVNLRFYYFAAAGIALLVAAGYARLKSNRTRAAFATVCVVAIVCGLGISHGVGKQWARSWRPGSHEALTLGAELNARRFPPQCRIYLDSEQWPPAFQPHVDSIVKSVADPDASIQGCAIFAGSVVFHTLLENGQCDLGLWPGLDVRKRNGTPLIGSIGNLCFIPFASGEREKLGSPLFRFHVDAQGHVQEELD
ncbi:MAG: hypothetical protein ABJB01_11935 [Rudaea sp.]